MVCRGIGIFDIQKLIVATCLLAAVSIYIFYKQTLTFSAFYSVGHWNTSEQLKLPHQVRSNLTEYNRTIPPLILFWYHPGGRRPNNNRGPIGNFHCGCNYTYNRTLVAHSDVVAFYSMGANLSDLPHPSTRNQRQKYVWWSREPPTHANERLTEIDFPDYYFNWTMTYRRDSDIPIPYSYLSDVMVLVKKENRSLEEILNKKTKVAVAVVSNCNKDLPGPTARMRLIKELNKSGLEVDKFGKCFKNRIKNFDKESVYDARQWKFYLSFENSYHCKDYISEKFWRNAIGSGIVPVVWGARRKEYEAVAPPSSFIFAEDFENPKALADYINYLDKNDTAYLEYLKWRDPKLITDKSIMGARRPPISQEYTWCCELCRALLKRREENDVSTSAVPSIRKYFHDFNDKDCLRTPNATEIYWKYEST